MTVCSSSPGLEWYFMAFIHATRSKCVAYVGKLSHTMAVRVDTQQYLHEVRNLLL